MRNTAPALTPTLGGTRARRSWWLKHLMRWHWISSALSLVGMLLFAVTGITLNHSGAISSQPRVHAERFTLANPVLATAREHARQAESDGPLPASVRDQVSERLGRTIPAFEAEWSSDEVYLALPRPGGDAWLSIDLASGEVEYELTDRGLVAWLNDLHKGRHTGPVWSAFIDLFAIACIVFTVTGLLILRLHASQRPLVWPMVGFGAVLPLLIILLFIH